MDLGFRTPLLDLFRHGNVDHSIRLLAARGGLAVRAHEQVALLVHLSADEDPDVAGAAEETIAGIPRDTLAGFIGRSDVPEELQSFFLARGIEPVSGATDDTLPLVDTEPEPAEAAEPDEKRDEASAVQKISAMNVAQRLGLAMKGSREERAILIRDPNKIVAVAVLSSPKLSETEVEGIARMANVSDEILRIIASTRAWVKNYRVVVALTKNPKTPVAVSMNLLSRLNERDLRMLTTDRNVPDVLRLTARKKIVIDK